MIIAVPLHSSTVFRLSLLEGCFMKCEKSGSHTISYQSLLLSTIVLNDELLVVVLSHGLYYHGH